MVVYVDHPFCMHEAWALVVGLEHTNRRHWATNGVRIFVQDTTLASTLGAYALYQDKHSYFESYICLD